MGETQGTIIRSTLFASTVLSKAFRSLMIAYCL